MNVYRLSRLSSEYLTCGMAGLQNVGRKLGLRFTHAPTSHQPASFTGPSKLPLHLQEIIISRYRTLTDVVAHRIGSYSRTFEDRMVHSVG